MNKGTRTLGHPEGTLNRILPLEVEGYEMARRVAHLCRLISQHGGFWSIENPCRSYLWHFAPIAQLLGIARAYDVPFDQCAYGLHIPQEGPNSYIKKRTTIRTNIPTLVPLAKNCPGISSTHKHVWAIGSVKINNKSVHRSALAGHYPISLCEAWADCLCTWLHSLRSQ